MRHQPTLRASVNWTVLVAISCLATGLAGTGCRKDPPISEPSATAAPDDRPAASTARIYFIRPHQVRGGNFPITVWDGLKLLGFLRHEETFYVDLPAGPHKLMGVAKTADVLEAELQAGKRYYVLCSFASFSAADSTSLTPLTPKSRDWDKRHDWISVAKAVDLHPENVSAWEKKYKQENVAHYAEHEKKPLEKLKFLNPEDGE